METKENNLLWKGEVNIPTVTTRNKKITNKVVVVNKSVSLGIGI